jgi:carbonic anhydrase
MFDDLMAANVGYRELFHDSGVSGRAVRRLAVLTCIDSRIDPLPMLGLVPGDAKILRNAGARVSNDALRSLVVAVTQLAVERICVVYHTECAMFGLTGAATLESLSAKSSSVPAEWLSLVCAQYEDAAREDLGVIRGCDLLPKNLTIGFFLFDVHDGGLSVLEV